ncbi:hypothetical protein CDD82_430 [Ophiocordyceps australis]|uniref:PX domain-containing protein n=1 Tax=Ophiocordyceps australis TaxID=1399860 RepID=A0A2C5ZVR3_9HYPO|nr:hypothetical protein CDD82_430 [Ophiocordyceps australis]
MAPPPEIAIPSTSVSDQGPSKQYTLYNITLRLPLRSFVVQRRYSEFAALHSTLVAQVGAPPPEPLPGKHWLRSTVKSAELAQQRQLGLERYLRAIAETPDRRWRDTAAWRGFLNLPTSAAGSAVSAAGRVGSSAVVAAADPTTWLDLHREVKQALHEARQALARRDAAVDGTAIAEAGAAAKRSLVKVATLISNLSDGLRRIQEAGRLGEGELRRRRDLVAAARMERDGLDKLSNTMPSSSSPTSTPLNNAKAPGSASEKTSFVQGGRPLGGGRVLGAPLPETNKTRELDNNGVLQLQQMEMEAQDEQVGQLAAIIRRQKEMGLRINEEVEAQSEMLDRMDQDAARVQGKVSVANKRIKKM